jgi:FMN phosphatase YigB (HAD superfamily)
LTPAVCSFDVFDTVLTRTVGGPEEVFVATGRLLVGRGQLTVGPHAFAAARRAAQTDLTGDVSRHPSLAELAAEVASRLGLGPAAGPLVAAAEADVERAVCRALPGSRERVAAARELTGRGVLFVSDTSLPRALVEDILVREGLLLPGDELFTSADAGASKQHGGLFDVVAQATGVPCTDIRHVGDDRRSDLVHARRHGWTAEWDPRSRLAGREVDLDADGLATDGFRPRLAAAARTVRLRAELAGLDAGLASVAGTVALPLLTGFARWVLHRARESEVDRLYFVARDGELLGEVVARLAQASGDPVECRYLYGSRRAWQLAATGRVGHDPVRDLWVPDDRLPEDLTPRELLDLLDLAPEDDVVQQAGVLPPGASADRPMGRTGWRWVGSRLREDVLVTAETQARAATRRDLLLAHLAQEGVTAPGRVALVDVGWTGRAARSLEDVLLEAGRPLPVAHLFVGLLESAPGRMGPDLFARSSGWLVDEARGRPGRSGDADPVMVVEGFVMGREGTTTGFDQVGDRVEPVLAAAVNPAARSWGLDDYRSLVSWGLDALVDGPGEALGPEVDLRSLVWRQVMSFWERPSFAEAAAWGRQAYGEDFANTRTHPLARPVTARRVGARLGLGPASWREPTYWEAGTIRLSPPALRVVLAAAVTARRTAARLDRVLPRLQEEWVSRGDLRRPVWTARRDTRPPVRAGTAGP